MPINGKTVRSIAVSLSNIEDDHYQQLNPFRAVCREETHVRVRDGRDSLWTSSLRAISYTKAGTALERAGLMGGHKS
jgi:DNA polymerase V